MPKKRSTSEEINHKLREAKVMSAQGKTVVEISWQLDYRNKPISVAASSMVA